METITEYLERRSGASGHLVSKNGSETAQYHQAANASKHHQYLGRKAHRRDLPGAYLAKIETL
jgi:hypothetical protein